MVHVRARIYISKHKYALLIKRIPITNVNKKRLFQVFVYTPQVYLRIKERLKSRGVAELSSLELSNYFSPWYAEHMGAIQSASGNRSVEAWATERLRVQYYIFTYASLLKLHGDAGLLRQLDSLLGNEALLQLQLRTLSPLFKDPKRRDWFLEVIDNYFKLWEVNMWKWEERPKVPRQKWQIRNDKQSLIASKYFFRTLVRRFRDEFRDWEAGRDVL